MCVCVWGVDVWWVHVWCVGVWWVDAWGGLLFRQGCWLRIGRGIGSTEGEGGGGRPALTTSPLKCAWHNNV